MQIFAIPRLPINIIDYVINNPVLAEFSYYTQKLKPLKGIFREKKRVNFDLLKIPRTNEYLRAPITDTLCLYSTGGNGSGGI